MTKNSNRAKENKKEKSHFSETFLVFRKCLYLIDCLENIFLVFNLQKFAVVKNCNKLSNAIRKFKLFKFFKYFKLKINLMKLIN